MASVTITLTNVCPGGNHLTYSVTGATAGQVQSELSETLSSLTDEERVAFVKCIAKLAKAGRTLAQARTILEAGVTVTV